MRFQSQITKRDREKKKSSCFLARFNGLFSHFNSHLEILTYHRNKIYEIYHILKAIKTNHHQISVFSVCVESSPFLRIWRFRGTIIEIIRLLKMIVFIVFCCYGIRNALSRTTFPLYLLKKEMLRFPTNIDCRQNSTARSNNVAIEDICDFCLSFSIDSTESCTILWLADDIKTIN